MTIITQAIYRLTTSAERFRTLFAGVLRSLVLSHHGMTATLGRESGMQRTAMIISVPMLMISKLLQRIRIVGYKRYPTIFAKSHAPRSYYLDNNYTYQHEDLDVWVCGMSTYTKDAIGCVERIYDCLSKVSISFLVANFHLELDKCCLFGFHDHIKFQMLPDTLQ